MNSMFPMLVVLWNLSNPTHHAQGIRKMYRIVHHVWTTHVLFQLTEILWDHKFLSDVGKLFDKR